MSGMLGNLLANDVNVVNVYNAIGDRPRTDHIISSQCLDGLMSAGGRLIVPFKLKLIK